VLDAAAHDGREQLLVQSRGLLLLWLLSLQSLCGTRRLTQGGRCGASDHRGHLSAYATATTSPDVVRPAAFHIYLTCGVRSGTNRTISAESAITLKSSGAPITSRTDESGNLRLLMKRNPQKLPQDGKSGKERTAQKIPR